MILIADILEEAKEAAGNCESALLYRTITRAVELLGNKKLIDPLKGTVDFSVDGSYYVPLPRDVHTPIRINIQGNPAFARSRLFEFTQNTDGSQDGEEIGWSWAERGYVCIQNERALPSNLKYKCLNAADAGKTCDVTGVDSEGREFTETLTAATDPSVSTNIFSTVLRVTREETQGECQLLTPENVTVARYYADETLPEYRLIKLTKTAVAIRLYYRRKTFKVTTSSDIIPIHSAQAVILMVKAVRCYARNEVQNAMLYEDAATRILKEEQATRELNEDTSGNTEIQTATDRNISNSEGLIAADIYDAASGIFGPIGRQKIFDQMTGAIETLIRKAQWDGIIGYTDVWRPANNDEVNVTGQPGNGVFVCPRFIGPILQLNINSQPAQPRNQWFEFHLNGDGERYLSAPQTWDNLPTTPVLVQPPLDATTRRVIPQQLAILCEVEADQGKQVRIYGREQTIDGGEREIYRNGERGFVISANFEAAYANDLPRVTFIDKVVKPETVGFLRLVMRNALIHVAALGDGGTDETDAKTVGRMVKNQLVSDVFLLGDVNYPDGEASGLDDNIGENWRPFIYPFLGDPTDAPLEDGDTAAVENHLWPVPGNHDWITTQDDTTDSSNFVTVSAVWTGPEEYRVRYFHLDRPDADNASLSEFTEDEGDGDLIETVVGTRTDTNTFTFALLDGSVLTMSTIPATYDNHFTVTRRFPLHTLEPYLGYFTLPGNQRYYSRVFGEVEVFYLDSDIREPDGYTIGSKQYLWLKSATAASKARWKIVCLHHAPYSSAVTHQDEIWMRWDFNLMGIHAVLGGHRHNYERLSKDGVQYFVVGTGGHSLVNFNVAANNPEELQKAGVVIDQEKTSLGKYDSESSGAGLRTVVINTLALEVNPPPVGSLIKDQLGNFVVISASADAGGGNISITFPDTATFTNNVSDFIYLVNRNSVIVGEALGFISDTASAGSLPGTEVEFTRPVGAITPLKFDTIYDSKGRPAIVNLILEDEPTRIRLTVFELDSEGEPTRFNASQNPSYIYRPLNLREIEVDDTIRITGMMTASPFNATVTAIKKIVYLGPTTASAGEPVPGDPNSFTYTRQIGDPTPAVNDVLYDSYGRRGVVTEITQAEENTVSLKVLGRDWGMTNGASAYRLEDNDEGEYITVLETLPVNILSNSVGFQEIHPQVDLVIPANSNPGPLPESIKRFKEFGALFILANASKLRFEFRAMSGQLRDVSEVTTSVLDTERLAGYYYPDETEPCYQVIKIATAEATRIRLTYRLRNLRISGMHSPIPLRSRRAIELMMMSMKAIGSDPANAAILEESAVNLLREERAAMHPNESLSLQIDEDTGAFHNDNIT